MSIISRYMIREHAGPFIFGLSTIAFIFMLNIIFRDIGRLFGKGLPVKIIFEFFAYNLAWVLALAIPMAVLIATLMAFGRLSSENEITALKASGVNLYRLIMPVFVLAVVLVILMFRFNDVILPDFNFRSKILYSDISRKKPTIALEPHVFYEDIENISILVHDIDSKTDRLENVLINDDSDPDFKRTVIAKSGELEFSKNQENMILTLYDGEIHEVEKKDLEQYRRLKFERQVFSIPVPDMVLKRSDSSRRGDREKTTGMLWDDIHRHEEAIQSRKERIRELITPFKEHIFPTKIWAKNKEKDAGLDESILPGSEKSYRLPNIQKQIQSETRVIHQYQKSIDSLRVEIEKKYSIPVACLVFVLIGAPLGIMARQGGIAVGGGMSLIFFLIYWTFLIGGEQLADRGLVGPVVAMWSPNVVVGAFGIYLVIHAVQEATFIPWQSWGEAFKKLIFWKKP